MFGKIKLRYNDRLYSKGLRKKRGYRCEKCGGYFPEGRGLEVSHFWTRAKESVRFDPENTDVFCHNDHQYFESHKTEYEKWKLNQLGKKKYDLLALRAHQFCKRDDFMMKLYIKSLMKEL